MPSPNCTKGNSSQYGRTHQRPSPQLHVTNFIQQSKLPRLGVPHCPGGGLMGSLPPSAPRETLHLSRNGRYSWNSGAPILFFYLSFIYFILCIFYLFYFVHLLFVLFDLLYCFILCIFLYLLFVLLFYTVHLLFVLFYFYLICLIYRSCLQIISCTNDCSLLSLTGISSPICPSLVRLQD